MEKANKSKKKNYKEDLRLINIHTIKNLGWIHDLYTINMCMKEFLVIFFPLKFLLITSKWWTSRELISATLFPVCELILVLQTLCHLNECCLWICDKFLDKTSLLILMISLCVCLLFVVLISLIFDFNLTRILRWRLYLNFFVILSNSSSFDIASYLCKYMSFLYIFRKPREKSEKEINKEICSVLRQITASVTFLPLLESACKLFIKVTSDSSFDFK